MANTPDLSRLSPLAFLRLIPTASHRGLSFVRHSVTYVGRLPRAAGAAAAVAAPRALLVSWRASPFAPARPPAIFPGKLNVGSQSVHSQCLEFDTQDTGPAYIRMRFTASQDRRTGVVRITSSLNG